MHEEGERHGEVEECTKKARGMMRWRMHEEGKRHGEVEECTRKARGMMRWKKCHEKPKMTKKRKHRSPTVSSSTFQHTAASLWPNIMTSLQTIVA